MPRLMIAVVRRFPFCAQITFSLPSCQLEASIATPVYRPQANIEVVLPKWNRPAMAPQFPSIQSFFQPEVSPTKSKASSSPPIEVGDGFTAGEVEATLHPSGLPKWQPRGTYDEADIESLVPGPRCVALMGRVVNFYDLHTPSKKPRAAKGCLKLAVKDDTGTIDASTISSIFSIEQKRSKPNACL